MWFFFCSPDKKYGTGSRKKRDNDIGFWKVTGNDTPIFYDSRIVGMKRSLVFHRGKAGRGDRTDWVMHEYRLEDEVLSDASISQVRSEFCLLLFFSYNLTLSNEAEIVAILYALRLCMRVPSDSY